jgi:phenylpyruvate tautomerase PptA (4-oxalocrotonate tautomerase family)
MPIVTISLRKGKTIEQRKALFDAVHDALVAAFKIPDSDRMQKIVEFDDENFEIPQGKTPQYTIIEIAVFPGRSREAKKELYRLIVEKLTALGIPATDVFILLNEQPLDNWGIRGGKIASEVPLGYDLKV